MSVYSIVGSMLLLLCGMAGARMMNRSDEAKLKQVEAFLTLLRYTGEQIDCYALSAPEILSRCDLRLLEACGMMAENVPRSFEELVQVCRCEDAVSINLMKRFADGFGKQNRAEQVKECDRYIEALSARQKLLSTEIPNKRKLHMTICLTGAAMAVILLL